MMEITVSVIARKAIDQPFSELVAPTVVNMPGKMVSFAPSLPAGADALELRLRVKSINHFSVAVGVDLDPTAPPPPRARIGLWGGQSRDIPFQYFQSFIFCAPGV